MADIIPVTQKPVQNKISESAHVLGVQDDGSGHQCLYRMPIKRVQGVGRTPEKGVDYWTEADKSEIVNSAVEEVSSSIEDYTADEINTLFESV